MSNQTSILACQTVDDLKVLFEQAIKDAGTSTSDQVKAANQFCFDLEKLIQTGVISFPSGGVDFQAYQGGRCPIFRPNTVVRIKK